MELPRVTLDEFLKFEPCWLDDEQGRRRLRYYARKLGGSADALEILALRRIPAEDRLWAVLRAEFIPDRILHEFACRCAEDALSRIDNPDPRSINAIAVKRRWIAGEATDEELAAARAAAETAAVGAFFFCVHNCITLFLMGTRLLHNMRYTKILLYYGCKYPLPEQHNHPESCCYPERLIYTLRVLTAFFHNLYNALLSFLLSLLHYVPPHHQRHACPAHQGDHRQRRVY